MVTNKMVISCLKSFKVDVLVIQGSRELEGILLKVKICRTKFNYFLPLIILRLKLNKDFSKK